MGYTTGIEKGSDITVEGGVSPNPLTSLKLNR